MEQYINIAITLVSILLAGVTFYGWYEISEEKRALREEEEKKREADKREKERKERERYKKEFNDRFGKYGKITLDILLSNRELDVRDHFLVFEDACVAVINNEEISFANILGFTMQDNSETIATSMSDSFESITSTSTGSMLGRAVVGGVLLGGVGAIAGAATAKQTTVTSPISSTTTTITKHDFALYINVNDLSNPTRKMYIGDDIELANRIASIFNIIIQRNSRTV